jgi:hypothetical protein
MSSIRYRLACHQNPCVSPYRAVAAPCRWIAVELLSGFARNSTGQKFCNAAVDDSSGLSRSLEPDSRGYCVRLSAQATFVLSSSSQSRAVRTFHLSGETKLRRKPRVLFSPTTAPANNRPPARTGRRPRSEEDIANRCGHLYRQCPPLVILITARRCGSCSTLYNFSRIGSKSFSVVRGIPSGMTASRRFISSSSFPAQWIGWTVSTCPPVPRPEFKTH